MIANMKQILRWIFISNVLLSISLESNALKCYQCDMSRRDESDPCYAPEKSSLESKACDGDSNVCVKQYDAEQDPSNGGNGELPFMTRACDTADTDVKPCEGFGKITRCYCNKDSCNNEPGYEATKADLRNIHTLSKRAKDSGSAHDTATEQIMVSQGALFGLLWLTVVIL